MPPLFLLQQRWPVEHHRDWRLVILPTRRRGHQEALAVGGNIPGLTERTRKQPPGNPDLEGGASPETLLQKFPLWRLSALLVER